MSGVRDPEEVVLELVDLLREPGLCVDQAIRPQHALDLGLDLRWLENVLQDGLYPDPVDGSLRQRHGVRIGHETDVRRIGDVERDRLDLRIGPEPVGAEPAGRAAHDHQPSAGAAEPSAAPGTARRSSSHPLRPGEVLDQAACPRTGDRVALDVIAPRSWQKASPVDEVPLGINQRRLAANLAKPSEPKLQVSVSQLYLSCA